MPAPAVIPAPIAYIKFVAVKKLVVDVRGNILGHAVVFGLLFVLGYTSYFQSVSVAIKLVLLG